MGVTEAGRSLCALRSNGGTRGLSSVRPPREYLENRNAYWYPAVGLAGSLDSWREVSFSSTLEMDCHHNELLTSNKNGRVVLGYLSTIFWGFYSGQDRVIRPARAKGKAMLALNGNDFKKMGRIERMRGVSDVGVDVVACVIRDAYAHLMSDQYAEALELLSELPQLGLAFASKVCAFLVPAKCGVIDSVLAERYPRFGFSADKKDIVKNTSDNRSNYRTYCLCLQQQAQTLNLEGPEFLWLDRDRIRHVWRAVDVERALFEDGRSILLAR